MLGDFDFLGLFLTVAATTCLLVGLQLGKMHWSSPSTICLIVIGGVLGLGCAINERSTSKSPIIPPRLFSTRTTSAILVGAAIHGFALFAGSYYIPLYFQILGVSATNAGIRTMGFSVVSSVSGSVAGLITTTRIGYRLVIWASWTIATIGYVSLHANIWIAIRVADLAIQGLMTMLRDTSPLYVLSSIHGSY